MYTIQTQQFTGPMQKLLELIEEKKLEVTTLNLAQVTAGFLEFVKKMADVHPSVMADFASVASRLILIKSKALLPDLKLGDEDEVEIRDLEKQLKVYKEIKNAGALLLDLWKSGDRKLYSRELFSGRQAVFYPPKDFNSLSLGKSLRRLLNLLAENELRVESVKFSLISLEKKIEDIISRIKKKSATTFSNLQDTKEKGELVVLFLAVLYLVKERLINVKQKKQFAEMKIVNWLTS